MSYTRRLVRGTMSSSSGVGRGALVSSAVSRRRIRPCARREVRQVAADVVEHRLVVLGEVVDHAAGERDAGPAEVLLRNLLARGLFDDRRTRGEDRALTAHDGEVADRCDQGAVPGRRAEQPGHGRNLAGALRLGEQVGRGAAVMLSAGPESGALEEHHQRHLVAQRQLGQPVALGVAAGPDAARERGEVLGTDHHRRAVDHPGAGDDSVGRDVAADERAELAERALVEQVLEPRAGVELALAAMFGQPLRRRPSTASADAEGRGRRASPRQPCSFVMRNSRRRKAIVAPACSR